MKTAKKFVKSLSLKYQILLAMTLLCLFPFLGLIIYTIHDSLAAMQKQSLSNELEYLDKTRLQLETYKESAKSYFTSKAVEDVFFSYCYNDLDFRSYTMLHDAQEELENFSYGQDILEGAYFINFKNSFLISSGFAGDFLPNEEGDNPIQTLLLENDSHQTAMWAYLPPWEGFTRPGKYPKLLIDGIVLLVPYPLFHTNSQSVMVVSIDPQKMNEFLGRSDTERQILIANEEDIILYSSNADEIGQNLSESPYLCSLSLEEKSGMRPITLDNQELYLTWIRDDNGWTYFSIIDLFSINQEMYTLWNTALLFGGIALIVLLLLIYLFSRKLSAPISAIANQMRQMTKDSTEGNELLLIKQGVDQYEEQMELYKNSLKEFFFQKLIKGSFSSVPPQKILDEAKRTGIQLHGTEMAILVFQMLEADPAVLNPDVSAASKIFSILPLDCVITSTFYQGLLVVWIQNLPYRTRFTERLREDCRRIKQEMTMESYLFGLGTSPAFHEYTQVHTAYLAAVADLGVGGSAPPMALDQNGGWTSDFCPEELCGQLAASMQNGTGAETDRLMDIISKRIFQESGDTGKQEILIIWSAASLFSGIQKKAPLPYEIFSSHLLDILARINDAKTMNYYFKKHLIQPLEKWMKDKNMEHQHDLSKEVIAMIQQRFDTDITLEQCAQELHCHPMYLWQLFKEQTNQTFSQYLENYRFYMAKKWLIETAKSVSEIADLLRYSNAQNFIRSFKKKTGMTPGKYRERNRCK